MLAVVGLWCGPFVTVTNLLHCTSYNCIEIEVLMEKALLYCIILCCNGMENGDPG